MIGVPIEHPTHLHLVCGMFDDYKYPANRTLTETIKLLERLHAGEEPVLEPVTLDIPTIEDNALPKPETATEQVAYPVMSREWLRESICRLKSTVNVLMN